MLEVEFHVYLPDGTAIPASELPADGGKAGALIDDFSDASGFLVVSDGKGGETVFADVLRILIPTFCLGGLAELLLDGQMRVDFFDHPETATLTVAQGGVTLAGDQIKTTTLPLDAYVAAQKACGNAYLDLARRVWDTDATHASALADLEAGLARSTAL